ncbi:hypothetical protein [Virgibacillus ndiopensis]|uniref:hypothetical protein n=1 Tax=Virgibacillus ndiopensis TaxID=2004408 RepID=UPI000C080A38|nr:hypothetical protein [Virgibacillus ndiopensis]
MLPIILSIVLIIALVLSISVVIKKRKKAGIKGIKYSLTSICLYLIAVINLLAYWLNFMGLLNWSITVILLIGGAYCTKYMTLSEN